jgi:hypothetical protein
MPGYVRHRWMIVTAEVWPFVSEGAFALATTALTEEAPGILSQATQALADDLEHWLQPRSSALSLEVLRQFRNSAWFSPRPFDSQPAQIPLDEHLHRVAYQYLCWDGNRVSLRMDSDQDHAERSRRYRWLSLLMPPDLLAAAIAVANNAELPDTGIRLVTPQLDQLLRQPVAETHFHVGAALRFHELWAGLMRRITYDEPKPANNSRESPLGNWDLLQRRFLEAGVARLLMARYLRQALVVSSFQSFQEYLYFDFPEVVRPLATDGTFGMLLSELLLAVSSLQRGDGRDPTRARLRLSYQRLLGRALPQPQSVNELLRQDPLWDEWSTRSSPEMALTTAALRYIQQRRAQQAVDPQFEITFWQYQRVRCLTYRYLSQEPGSSGLDWFQEHYNRIATLRGSLDRMSFLSALGVDSRDAHLAASEPRTTPDRRWPDVRDYVRSIAEQAHAFTPPPGRPRPEVGLVFHFVKQKERQAGATRRLPADPDNPVYPCRYGSWYADGLERVRAMTTALRCHPELLVMLRGIDVASIEQAVPSWPVLPLLRQVRDASRRAAELLAFRLPHWNVPPLRMTLHAGEDFRRLIEGLRRIHEPLEAGVMTAGDRFGHALALGTNPRSWAEAGHLIWQPREERLDDLLWELTRYRSGALPCHTGRVEVVRAEAEDHIRAIYGSERGYTLEHVRLARTMRHDVRWLQRLSYPHFRSIPDLTVGEEVRCFEDYLHDPVVFARGQEAVEVSCLDSEIDMLEHAQRWLRKELARLEITVEGNPSSNLVIGDLSDLIDHPVFRLMPFQSVHGEPQVHVSINTDNPITFSTCIADEFAHTYYALVHAGISAAEALDWLDRAREAGWRSRFTLEASTDPTVLCQVINAWRRSSFSPRSLSES